MLYIYSISGDCQPRPDILWRFNNYYNDKTFSDNYTTGEKTNIGTLGFQTEITIDESINAYCAHLKEGNKYYAPFTLTILPISPKGLITVRVCYLMLKIVFHSVYFLRSGKLRSFLRENASVH